MPDRNRLGRATGQDSQDSRRPVDMQQSLTWCLRRSSLRWLAACGVTAALALPSIPAAAQVGDATSSGASTPANCTIQLSVANPNLGDQEIPHTLIMSGTAVDTTAASGAG